MSQWTHIAGLIRVDDLVLSPLDNPKEKIARAFGNTAKYESSKETWDKCNVPYGSEGSVQYQIERTGSNNELAWGVVFIWGDLRNYSGANEIYDWLVNACKDLMIRSCIVKIDIEYVSSWIVYDKWNDEKNKTELILEKIGAEIIAVDKE